MKTNEGPVPEIEKFLGSMPLFSNISESSARSLARAGKFQHVDKGEMIFCQADASEAAYVVRTGNISIVLLSADGREMIINEMHSGDVFGELGILTKKPRSTSAIAQSRLARFLLELEEQEQRKGYITISQEELAHRTGLIRQTVAKALGKWRL
jgi:CRP-like cAMP-binding protein